MIAATNALAVIGLYSNAELSASVDEESSSSDEGSSSIEEGNDDLCSHHFQNILVTYSYRRCGRIGF